MSLRMSPTPATVLVTGLFANGTAALPSISFSNDSDTGLFKTGTANELSISIAGTERLRYSAAAFAFQEGTTISTSVGNLLLNPSGFIDFTGNEVRFDGSVNGTITFPNSQRLQILSGGVNTILFNDTEPRIQITSGRIMSWGTSAFSTAGTNNIVMIEGTAPSGTLADSGGIYVRDAAGVTELTYIDSGGTVSNVT